MRIPSNELLREQFYRDLIDKCLVSEQAGECLVRLPLFNSMCDDDQTRVIETALTFVP
jgi:dTDP-4-amino-4,6-dideoxygalactose transaminase